MKLLLVALTLAAPLAAKGHRAKPPIVAPPPCLPVELVSCTVNGDTTTCNITVIEQACPTGGSN